MKRKQNKEGPRSGFTVTANAAPANAARAAGMAASKAPGKALGTKSRTVLAFVLLSALASLPAMLAYGAVIAAPHVTAWLSETVTHAVVWFKSI